MSNEKITESESLYDGLESKSTRAHLVDINSEDKKVANAVQECIPAIEKLVDELAKKYSKGGRLFYIGAGTSGRLGILDASEIPPTYGMPHDRVIGLIAGGDSAIRKAVEFAEDDTEQAWKDLLKYDINENDVLVGIAASGTTPYVIGGIEVARKHGILTACITNNPNSPLTKVSDIPIVAVVGPEYVTGSTRMKSGTSQKLILNMISSVYMIKVGRVKGNKMVHMQLSNNKLVDRGTRYVSEALNIDYNTAQELIEQWGSVDEAIKEGRKSKKYI